MFHHYINLGLTHNQKFVILVQLMVKGSTISEQQTCCFQIRFIVLWKFKREIHSSIPLPKTFKLPQNLLVLKGKIKSGKISSPNNFLWETLYNCSAETLYMSYIASYPGYFLEANL